MFQINRDSLKKGISRLRNTLARDTINPITKHFLFEVKDKSLVIKSTNNVTSSIWKTSLDSEDNVSFTIPGDTFSSLISSLEGDVVTFDYSPMSKDVTMTCGKYFWDASSGDVTTFPNVTVPDDLEELVLPANFQGLLKSVAFSISSDVTKSDLNSLCVDINRDKDGLINLLSTDRFRLSCASFSLDSPRKGQVRFLIPKNSLSEVMKFEPTKLLFDSTLRKAYFVLEEPTSHYIFQTVLTNASYSDIYAYLKGSFPGESETIQIKKHDLVRALKRTMISSDKSVGRFTFNRNCLVLSTLNEINTSKSKESLEVLYESDVESTFSVNVDYLLDYLSQESLDIISFKIVNGKCFVFDKDNYRHVLSIMP